MHGSTKRASAGCVPPSSNPHGLRDGRRTAAVVTHAAGELEMVIRRIRRHAATQNWFAVLIDLAIVVAGVFLGTQANNWNAERLARSDARVYRNRLIEDVLANQVDLAAREAYYGTVRQHGIAALAALAGTRETDGESLLVDAYQASQINARALRRSTYNELVGAGALTTIGDRPLRDLAETYYQGLTVLDTDNSRLPPYRDRIRRELPYDIVQRIRANCGDRTSEVGGTVIFRLPASCQLGLAPLEKASAVARLRQAPELDRDLSRYLVDIDQRLANFAGSARRSTVFLAALRRENAAN
jgi:hypothetical protein